MHKSVQNFRAEECLKHLNRIDDFLNCFLPSGLLFQFFNAGRCESISCLSKVLPLWCRRESTTCLQGRVLQLHSGTVPHVRGWYSTKIYVWGAVPHCTSCLQGRVVATGRWLRLPSHNSMVCFTKYLVHCSIVLGMLHLVPGTVLLGTNKPYNRSSGPPCRLLYFCRSPHTGAATQLFVIQSLMGTLSP